MAEDMMQTGQAEQPQDSAQTEGYCIEICVFPGGKITVEQGPLEADDTESTGTPVKSIDEALIKAKEMFQNGGQDGGEAFDEGFGKAAQPPLMVREGE